MDESPTYATPDPGSDHEDAEYKEQNFKTWIQKTNSEPSRSVKSGLRRHQEYYEKIVSSNRCNGKWKKNEKAQLIPMAAGKEENGGNTEEPTVSAEAKDGEVKITLTAPGAETLDMVDRDPTNMNSHVRVGFDEVFAEPDGIHSFNAVWRFSYLTFFNTKFWCYRIITLICAVPAAILWGFYFALLTFTHIWCVVPCIKAVLIKLQCAGQLFSILVRTFMEPVYLAISKIFSNIHITMTKD